MVELQSGDGGVDRGTGSNESRMNKAIWGPAEMKWKKTQARSEETKGRFGLIALL